MTLIELHSITAELLKTLPPDTKVKAWLVAGKASDPLQVFHATGLKVGFDNVTQKSIVEVRIRP